MPFHPVNHPTLGKVEVGGWKPGVRLNPPIEQVGAIVDTHFAFLKDLAGRVPSLSIKEAKAEAKGGGSSRSRPRSRTRAHCQLRSLRGS